MKKNSGRFVFIIFAIAGIAMFIGGIFFLIEGISFREKAVEITAEIVDIETRYELKNGEKKRYHDVYVDYTYNGVEYNDVSLNEYNSGMSVGERITLLCDPDNPGDIRSNTATYLTPGLMMGMGLIFALIGIIPFINSIKKDKLQKRLLTEGRVLQATIESISLNTSVRVNGSSPYVIYCAYTDENSGVIYRFKSNNLWSDPSYMFAEGGNVQVYVDRNDFSKYYVNVEHTMSQRIVDYT